MKLLSRTYCIASVLLVFTLIGCEGSTKQYTSASPQKPRTSAPFGQSWTDSNGITYKWVGPGNAEIKYTIQTISRDPEKIYDETESIMIANIDFGFYIAKDQLTVEQVHPLLKKKEQLTANQLAARLEHGNIDVYWRQVGQICESLTNAHRDAGSLPEGWKYSLPSFEMWLYAMNHELKPNKSTGDEWCADKASVPLGDARVSASTLFSKDGTSFTKGSASIRGSAMFLRPVIIFAPN